MRITIVGGGNMGGAVARGLVNSGFCQPSSLTVVNRREAKAEEMRAFNADINAVVGDYSAIRESDVVIIAVKPWHVEALLKECCNEYLSGGRQIVVSMAATVKPVEIMEWTGGGHAVYRAIPNTAAEVLQSMTYITGYGGCAETDAAVLGVFGCIGKAEMIEERMLPAAMSLCSCGIAFAFRYIRAAMEGGVEMGLYPGKAKEGVLQTLKGAVALLEERGSHPEQEVDRVTTAGGVTIKGLNEMEHAGFSSAVVRGLKASKVE